MKKYRISNCGSELDWMKYFESIDDIKLVPILDMTFLDDNIETALKQAFCSIMNYLKTSSFEIRDISVENVYGSVGAVKYIIFRNYGCIQGFFKLEEVIE